MHKFKVGTKLLRLRTRTLTGTAWFERTGAGNITSIVIVALEEENLQILLYIIFLLINSIFY